MNKGQLQQYLDGMILDLNLKLLLETEPAERLLWVESAAVTAYQPAPEKTDRVKMQMQTQTQVERLRNCFKSIIKKLKKERR